MAKKAGYYDVWGTTKVGAQDDSFVDEGDESNVTSSTQVTGVNMADAPPGFNFPPPQYTPADEISCTQNIYEYDDDSFSITNDIEDQADQPCTDTGSLTNLNNSEEELPTAHCSRQFTGQVNPTYFSLPTKMTLEEINAIRKTAIIKAVTPPSPNSKIKQLRDEDLDIPEVAEEFDKVYPFFLPPLGSIIRLKHGKHTLHRKRWIRRIMWNFFWRQPVEQQIALFNSRPNLKIFFDQRFGTDTFQLIRYYGNKPGQTTGCIPCYNELRLMPEGFPTMSAKADPYLSLEDFRPDAYVPEGEGGAMRYVDQHELDVDKALQICRQYGGHTPTQSLEELLGPIWYPIGWSTLVYDKVEKDKIIGFRPRTRPTENLPDVGTCSGAPRDLQTQEFMRTGSCDDRSEGVREKMD